MTVSVDLHIQVSIGFLYANVTGCSKHFFKYDSALGVHLVAVNSGLHMLLQMDGCIRHWF